MHLDSIDSAFFQVQTQGTISGSQGPGAIGPRIVKVWRFVVQINEANDHLPVTTIRWSEKKETRNQETSSDCCAHKYSIFKKIRWYIGVLELESLFGWNGEIYFQTGNWERLVFILAFNLEQSEYVNI